MNLYLYSKEELQSLKEIVLENERSLRTNEEIESVCNNFPKGVSFTGSHKTAKYINKNLASKEGAITPIIAETGDLYYRPVVTQQVFVGIESWH